MSLRFILKLGSNQLVYRQLRKEYSRVLIKNGKNISHNSLRTYRNISHGQPPPMTLIGFLFPIFLMCIYVWVVIDFKKLFGLYDEEKELEELMNYTIPDLVATYSVKPGLEDTNESEKPIENVKDTKQIKT